VNAAAARHWDAQYSWNAHVGQAAELGVSRESLTALAENREPHFTRDDEEVVYRFSAEILGDHFVSDAAFADALAEPDVRGFARTRSRGGGTRRPVHRASALTTTGPRAQPRGG
jgi:hypothetical protein